MRLVLALLFAALAQTSLAQGPVIAAAADLKFALEEIAGAFRRDTGHTVRLSFGSSGNFAQQIENGAPFELFLAADERYVERVVANGRAHDDGIVYAEGRLALFIPSGSPLRADATLADLRDAAADGRLRRFAIANPEHAPYGRAAREALQRAGLWEAVAPRLVLGENAAQATQFASTGATQGGIVPWPLARAPEVAKLGTSVMLAPSLHEPLRQRMVLLKGAGPVATRFYAYVQAEPAQRILAKHGFVVPSAGGP